MGTTALVAGATGLVGKELVRQLLADPTWSKVTTVGRRPVGFTDERLEEIVLPLEQLNQAPAATHVFCCLGTTRAKAGSKTAFAAVDLEAVAALAQRAQEMSARWFGHVSAVGANPHSLIFYNRIKGQAEQAVIASGIAASSAVRPSLLDGAREEFRLLESLGLMVARPLGRVVAPLSPTPATAVAAALRHAAHNASGHEVISARQLRRFESR